MENKEYKKLKIECIFNSPNYGKVACVVDIGDFVAIARFSDVRLAKDMFNAEKKLGNTNQKFNERLKCIIELYPNKTKEEIAKELIDKFEEHNIEVKKKYGHI
jgi:hypothetical protein